MTKKVINNTGLAIKERLKLELVLYTKHSQLFLDLCKDVKIAIGGLKTRHSIYVIEVEDHDLVLEQPFLNAVKFSQYYKQNKILGSITHS